MMAPYKNWEGRAGVNEIVKCSQKKPHTCQTAIQSFSPPLPIAIVLMFLQTFLM